MEMSTHLSLPVTDRSHVAIARQETRQASERVGFDHTDAHRAGLIATELSSNLAKHAPAGGQILLRTANGGSAEVELIAIDRGPGIADVGRSLSDGFSTAGSAGTGLGAIRRLADEFDIYSQPGQGTAVFVRVRRDRCAAPSIGGLQLAGVSVAKPGETECGDAWAVAIDRGRIMVFVIDGLGHGPYAAEAARTAARVAMSRPFDSVLEALTEIHAGLRHTRGAATTIVQVDLQSQVVTVSGVGNVMAAILSPTAIRHGVSLNGILGHDVRQFKQFQYPWTPSGALVLHTDGLISHWSLDGYPGLRQRHVALTAAVLYRDYQRGRDDVTVIAGWEAA
jgi:anti-sigma regulatory factor (Ser/Thr protein kinase)